MMGSKHKFRAAAADIRIDPAVDDDLFGAVTSALQLILRAARLEVEIGVDIFLVLLTRILTMLKNYV